MRNVLSALLVLAMIANAPAAAAEQKARTLPSVKGAVQPHVPRVETPMRELLDAASLVDTRIAAFGQGKPPANDRRAFPLMRADVTGSLYGMIVKTSRAEEKLRREHGADHPAVVHLRAALAKLNAAHDTIDASPDIPVPVDGAGTRRQARRERLSIAYWHKSMRLPNTNVASARLGEAIEDIRAAGIALGAH